MTLKNKRLNGSLIYLVLDKAVCGKKNIKNILKKAILGGVSLVQYRDKFSETLDVIKEAKPLLRICRSQRVPFIINDRLDAAIALNADGLHVGQSDMPVNAARKALGRNKIIGLSCHSVNQVKNAQRYDVDYLGFGPVFKTATKPKIKPLGAKALQKALSISRLPIFAIGGITEKRIPLLTLKISKVRVACIREICLAKNPKKAAQRLRMRLSRVLDV